MRPQPPRRRPRSIRGVAEAAETPIPPELTDKARGERLQRVMAEFGVASRRHCELLIREGRVQVNGQPVVDLPAWVDPATDRIEVNGQVINKARKSPKPDAAALSAPPRSDVSARTTVRRVYIMVNKPRGVISTASDDLGRRSVLDLVDLKGQLPAGAPRLYPVGRLDAESTGLILLTNDGTLTERLTHPSHEVSKHYTVTCRGQLSDDQLKKLNEGLYLAQRKGSKNRPPAGRARRASADHVQRLAVHRDRARGDTTLLEMTLTEGQNREIRRLVAAIGSKVRRLHRDGIGPLRLKGLATGEWRFLTTAEVRKLFHAAGLEDPARARRHTKKKKKTAVKGGRHD